VDDQHRGRYICIFRAGTSGIRTPWGSTPSDSPVGPFVYDERSPLLKVACGLPAARPPASSKALAAACGAFYQCCCATTAKMDRRLAMDPVGFDESGHGVRGPSDTPQVAPGAAGSARNQATTRAVASRSTRTPAESAAPDAIRLPVDGYARTWWQGADERLPQTLEIDLAASSACTRSASSARAGRVRRQASGRWMLLPLELSSDGIGWRTVHEHADRRDDRDIHYCEIEPIARRPRAPDLHRCPMETTASVWISLPRREVITKKAGQGVIPWPAQGYRTVRLNEPRHASDEPEPAKVWSSSNWESYTLSCPRVPAASGLRYEKAIGSCRDRRRTGRRRRGRLLEIAHMSVTEAGHHYSSGARGFSPRSR